MLFRLSMWDMAFLKMVETGLPSWFSLLRGLACALSVGSIDWRSDARPMMLTVGVKPTPPTCKANALATTPRQGLSSVFYFPSCFGCPWALMKYSSEGRNMAYVMTWQIQRLDVNSGRRPGSVVSIVQMFLSVAILSLRYCQTDAPICYDSA